MARVATRAAISAKLANCHAKNHPFLTRTAASPLNGQRLACRPGFWRLLLARCNRECCRFQTVLFDQRINGFRGQELDELLPGFGFLRTLGNACREDRDFLLADGFRGKQGLFKSRLGGNVRLWLTGTNDHADLGMHQVDAAPMGDQLVKFRCGHHQDFVSSLRSVHRFGTSALNEHHQRFVRGIDASRFTDQILQPKNLS